MITVKSHIHQEKLGIIEKEIILNGPPSRLQGSVLFVNKESDLLRVKTLALVDSNKKQIQDGNQDFLRFSFRLRPGETKQKIVRHQLPAFTPPGTYENYIMLGDEKHKVKMVVQPTIAISVYPDEFTFQGTAPGTNHVAVITLTNHGNMPFQVPELKHAAVLDMDLLCRAFGKGFRERGKDDLISTLDEVAKNIKNNLTDWVSISVDESGVEVQPGNSILLHVNFTIPKNAETRRDYEGNFRFWDKDLSVLIKSHGANDKNRKHEQQSK